MFDYSYISTFKKEGAYNGKRVQINQTVLGRRKKREEIIISFSASEVNQF